MVEILTQIEKEELIEHYYTHIFDFAQDFLPHFLKVKTPDFHLDIYNLLKDPGFYAISAPRGFAKSTVCSKIFPIWAGCFKHLGDVSIISASEDFVIRELTTPIREEFESNKRLIKIFGPQKTTQWSASYFKLKNGMAFEGLGINGQLRGGRRGNIILDDIENNESVENEDQRSKIRDKINKEIIPKLLPEAALVFIGTIIHPLCHLNSVLKKPNNGWTKREYRAYNDAKFGEEDKYKKGNELWKELWDHEKLKKRMETIGSHAFASEYLNDPVSDDSKPIKEDQIRRYTKVPPEHNIYIVLDPAYTEDEKSDYKVAAVIAVDKYSNRYLVEYIRTRVPLGQYMDACLNLYVKYRNTCSKVGVPRGREVDFWNSIHNKAQQRGLFPPFAEIKYLFRDANSGESIRNKKKRMIRTLQPLFESGKYFIGADHEEAVEELLTFGVPHDDLIDAMSGAEQIIEPLYSYQEVENHAKEGFGDDDEDFEQTEEEVNWGGSGYGDF